MSVKWWRRSGIAGLILSVASAAGCEGGGTPTTAERPGPAISKDKNALTPGTAGNTAVPRRGSSKRLRPLPASPRFSLVKDRPSSRSSLSVFLFLRQVL